MLKEPERVWITGASSGIGRAVALRFVRAGATVLASGRDRAALDALRAAASAGPGRVACHAVDVTDRDAVSRIVAAMEAAEGPIGRALLNAGTYEPVEAVDFDAGAFDRQFAVNVGGTVNCLQALLPAMRARGRGQIAIVGSLSGYRGLRRASAYGASKGALMRLAESLHQDQREAGLDIRLVSPGFVRTPLTDRNDFAMPFLIEAEEAAARIHRGLVDGRRFEIAFPRRFAAMIRLGSMLPYGLYFPLMRRLTG
ncbi:MAG: SDR family NAD(P)-dependent oxidoreductase [Sneathiellaceae bacterium]